MKFRCASSRRRSLVSEHADFNGIDYLEVQFIPESASQERQVILEVHFLKSIWLDTIGPQNIRIDGGETITNVVVTSVTLQPPDNDVLEVELSTRGDFSTYTLRLVENIHTDKPPQGFEYILSWVEFSFQAGEPLQFDLQVEEALAAEAPPAPNIDYLAKDYASFRRLLLDRLALTLPGWNERNPSDMEVALVELLAYVADQLSYYQDAAATEAYLDTARQRTSVRRHARLLDYHTHEGCNARVWAFLEVISSSANGKKLDKGLRLLTGYDEGLYARLRGASRSQNMAAAEIQPEETIG